MSRKFIAAFIPCVAFGFYAWSEMSSAKLTSILDDDVEFTSPHPLDGQRTGSPMGGRPLVVTAGPSDGVAVVPELVTQSLPFDPPILIQKSLFDITLFNEKVVTSVDESAGAEAAQITPRDLADEDERLIEVATYVGGVARRAVVDLDDSGRLEIADYTSVFNGVRLSVLPYAEHSYRVARFKGFCAPVIMTKHEGENYLWVAGSTMPAAGWAHFLNKDFLDGVAKLTEPESYGVESVDARVVCADKRIEGVPPMEYEDAVLLLHGARLRGDT